MNEEKYEVLVIDNNSNDDTSEVIKKFSEQNTNIKGLEENNIQSSYAARNRGIENSKGDIICFLDADMWVEQTYLSNIKNYFKENREVDYIGCNVEMVNKSKSLTARYSELKGFPVEEYMKRNFAPTCCLSVRRKIFSEIGLFNEKLVSGGDKLFGKKADERDVKMDFAGEIKVYHPVRDNWRQIASKYFRIARGWYQKEYYDFRNFEDERARARNMLVVLSAVLNETKEDMLDEKISFKEVIAFTSLNFVKKISMFSGYQYERISSFLK